MVLNEFIDIGLYLHFFSYYYHFVITSWCCIAFMYTYFQPCPFPLASHLFSFLCVKPIFGFTSFVLRDVIRPDGKWKEFTSLWFWLDCDGESASLNQWLVCQEDCQIYIWVSFSLPIREFWTFLFFSFFSHKRSTTKCGKAEKESSTVQRTKEK